MKSAAPLVIATLVSIAVALSSPFLAPKFVRPAPLEALRIVEAVGDYEFRSIAAELETDQGSLMPEAAKIGRIRVVDTAPCGETIEPVQCDPMQVDAKSEIGRMLLASWRDASKLITPRRREMDGQKPSFEEDASPFSQYLFGLQVSASQTKDRRIVPSGLTDDMVRRYVKLRADTPPDQVRTYFAPWIVGDTAFVEVGWSCGDMCGTGTGYALRKEKGKWWVIAVQSRWIV